MAIKKLLDQNGHLLHEGDYVHLRAWGVASESGAYGQIMKINGNDNASIRIIHSMLKSKQMDFWSKSLVYMSEGEAMIFALQN